jgi:hypothetical protein
MHSRTAGTRSRSWPSDRPDRPICRIASNTRHPAGRCGASCGLARPATPVAAAPRTQTAADPRRPPNPLSAARSVSGGREPGPPDLGSYTTLRHSQAHPRRRRADAAGVGDRARKTHSWPGRAARPGRHDIYDDAWPARWRGGSPSPSLCATLSSAAAYGYRSYSTTAGRPRHHLSSPPRRRRPGHSATTSPQEHHRSDPRPGSE